MVKIKTVNRWAQLSCARWNKNKFMRRYFRKKYQNQANKYLRSSEYKAKRKEYKKGNAVDTYPYPYSDPEFANWPESDDENDYSLISDQSGFVVKYASSYVAFKIFEVTGKWPKRKSKKRFDAKNWIAFLEEAGYSYKCDAPILFSVGILKQEYISSPAKKTTLCEAALSEIQEYGLVVWFEGWRLVGGDICVSTYLNHKYIAFDVDQEHYDWVKIKGAM